MASRGKHRTVKHTKRNQKEKQWWLSLAYALDRLRAKFSKKPTKKPAPKKLKGKKKRGNRLCVVILNVAVFQAK